MSKTFHCPNCGAPLSEPLQERVVIRCAYCSSSVIVPEELRHSLPDEPILTPAESLFNLPKLANAMRQAAALNREGKKEEAVQLLLDQLRLEDQEAHQIITQMDKGQIIQLGGVENRFTGHTVTLNGENSGQLLTLLREGKEKEALEHYQRLTGAAEEDARLALDAMQMATSLLDQPPLRQEHSQTAKIAGGAASIFAAGGCLSILITALVLLFTFGVVVWALVSDGGPLEGWWTTINPFARAPVVLSFGGQGFSNGTFDDPREIAVDEEGRIYVSDYRTGRVQQFNPQGKFLHLWIEKSIRQSGASSQPTINSLDAGDDGILYIVYDGAIYRLNTAEDAVLPPIELDQLSIEQVFITPEGKIAVIANGDDLALLTADGEMEWIVKDAIESVTGESELTAYLGGDGLGNFYLAGAFTYSVFKYSADGKYLNRFGSRGDEPGEFRAINAVRVDSQGRVYVSDTKGVLVFSATGQYLHTLPVQGVAFGMDISPDDRLYLITNQPKVVVYQLAKD